MRFDSTVLTIRVPPIPGSPDLTTGIRSPAPVIENAKYDLVVKVRNNSFAAYVFLAFDEVTLVQLVGASQGSFKLPAGAEVELTLRAGQSLYAGVLASDYGELSAHIFEAFPVDASLA